MSYTFNVLIKMEHSCHVSQSIYSFHINVYWVNYYVIFFYTLSFIMLNYHIHKINDITQHFFKWIHNFGHKNNNHIILLYLSAAKYMVYNKQGKTYL